MVQVDRLCREIRRQFLRIGVLMAVVVLSLLGASCKSLIVTKDRSIPKLITPLADASFEDLAKQVKPFADLQSLRTRVGIVFQDTGLAER